MKYEYVANGKTISLPVNPGKVAVRFRETVPNAMRAAAIDPRPELGVFKDRLEIPNEKFTVVDVADAAQPGPSPLIAAHTALAGDQSVARTAPVFDLGNGQQAVATDRVLVGFKPEATPEKAVTLLSGAAGPNASVKDEGGGEYTVQLGEAADPFAVIQNLGKYPEVAYAEPDFVTLGQHQPRRPPAIGTGVVSAGGPAPLNMFGQGGNPAPMGGNDPLLARQYATQITQSVDAWGKVKASPTIKIAILDEGVDVTHPDLAAAIVGSFDAVGDGSDDTDQQPNPWDGHGTACAGLAAAVPNQIGIRGIGGGCSLLAVRIASSPAKGADWATSNSAIRAAIDWAWQNGADILSNSWGGGAPSTAVEIAFDRARTQGRDGKGCVVVIAAGNAQQPLDFPAYLPNVLTVAATNEFDEPKTKTSRDGENWWGSSFGPEVDIAAPGVHNYTTDITGADGYNTGGNGGLSGDYVSNFNGTSSATPIVAGAAALVLSANPFLYEADVRSLLKNTADKIGGVVYTNGHNDQMGFGRLNVLRAVEAALLGVGSPLIAVSTAAAAS